MASSRAREVLTRQIRFWETEVRNLEATVLDLDTVTTEVTGSLSARVVRGKAEPNNGGFSIQLTHVIRELGNTRAVYLGLVQQSYEILRGLAEEIGDGPIALPVTIDLGPPPLPPVDVEEVEDTDNEPGDS